MKTYIPQVKKVDPEMADLIQKECKRQEETLMMIPSENIASEAVQQAVGSCLANKYAEGYPHKRYYQGQQYVDQIENLTKARAVKAFGVVHANVQALSGSPANLAVYLGLLKPGDTIMGLDLSHGGHLTHGSKVSTSGIYYHSVSYTLNKDGRMDYEAIEKLAIKHKPQIIVAGITAYPLKINWSKFAKIADKVGAYLMADVSHLSGLIVAGVYPSPAPYAHVITTTTHKTLRGPRGAMIMVTKKGIKKNPDLPKIIDNAVFPRLQGGPHINTIAGIGVALKEAMTPRFKKYGAQIIKNTETLAKELKGKGFHLVAGGSNTHLILIDLKNKGIIGNLAAEALEAANIVLNRNSVPFDTNPPFYPSGIRMGTPGITSRGMKEKEMVKIATWISDIIDDIGRLQKEQKLSFDQVKKSAVRQKLIASSQVIKEVKKEVLKLCQKFPIQAEY
ncbi:MAG TPA: serine hydroxymethyltransferase [Candidatus Woesebacteria bacterium]|nr:serine hydroxymethyltransferase [Candidatus Woesebacteria bacterium]